MSEKILLKSLSYVGRHINEDLQGKAWVGHTQFAYWLVATLKPRILVELGTHGGGSYFSFCQSVLDHNLDTKTFAVDTWIGEKQAGFYSESVFNHVTEYNKKNYDNFSTLMRMKFHEALPFFKNSSVDFLHIDGFHSYDAVKNDYETWFEKLSENAVILFHDTNTFKKDYEVHRFWKELNIRYPRQCFEFMHSHGLGILFPKSLDLAINFKKKQTIELEKIFNIFTTIGDELYYKINGKYSLTKNFQLNYNQLLDLLIKIKKDNPLMSDKIKKIFD